MNQFRIRPLAAVVAASLLLNPPPMVAASEEETPCFSSDPEIYYCELVPGPCVWTGSQWIRAAEFKVRFRFACPDDGDYGCVAWANTKVANAPQWTEKELVGVCGEYDQEFEVVHSQGIAAGGTISFSAQLVTDDESIPLEVGFPVPACP